MIIKCYSGGKIVRRFEIIDSETLRWIPSSRGHGFYIEARSNDGGQWTEVFCWRGEYSTEFNNLKNILKKG